MASLNKMQRDYATGRLKKAFHEKVETYRNEHCLIRAARTLTKEQKEALIYAGGVPFKNGLSAYHADAMFDFSTYENANEYDTSKAKQYEDKLRKELSKAEDAIMLGDATEIMEVIAKFEKK